ncbi:MAG: NAD-dependent epimerase/dehydratase family protein [Anaerolineae bacterium]|nr:MAG: NAD-dependent epimerase/dehydratase family protein [Anaerolineae bacterium]
MRAGGKKILITGGAGFIGSALARACLEAGFKVVVVDDFSRGRVCNLPPGVRIYRLDVRAQDRLVDVFRRERPVVVSHHAALVSVRESVAKPDLYWQINVDGTRNVLQAAQSCGARHFVFASSGGAIYGEAERLPLDEDAPCRPISPYGESKLAAEEVIRSSAFAGIKTILRYGNVYGPGQDPANNNGVIAIFARALQEGRRPVIFGDGSQSRDYVYVSDVVAAHMLAVQQGAAGVFNIASGQARSLREVYNRIAALLGVDIPPRYLPENAFEVRHNGLAIERSRQVLGWTPQVDFSSGLKATLQVLQEETV